MTQLFDIGDVSLVLKRVSWFILSFVEFQKRYFILICCNAEKMCWHLGTILWQKKLTKKTEKKKCCLLKCKNEWLALTFNILSSFCISLSGFPTQKCNQNKSSLMNSQFVFSATAEDVFDKKICFCSFISREIPNKTSYNSLTMTRERNSWI